MPAREVPACLPLYMMCRLLRNNFHARLFWRKYVTTNETVGCAVFVDSLQDFLVHHLAVEAGEVTTLLAPGNRDLLIATVDDSGEGMVRTAPHGSFACARTNPSTQPCVRTLRCVWGKSGVGWEWSFGWGGEGILQRVLRYLILNLFNN